MWVEPRLETIEREQRLRRERSRLRRLAASGTSSNETLQRAASPAAAPAPPVRRFTTRSA